VLFLEFMVSCTNALGLEEHALDVIWLFYGGKVLN
jgi:hypothetical protein